MPSFNINVSSEANSGSGDNLRDAFIAVRKNLAQVFGITYSSDTQDISGTTFTSDVITAGSTNKYLLADSVTNAKLGAEFTTTSPLSSAATIAVDVDSADIFTYTAGHSATLNFTDVTIGAMKSLMITGGGSSYTVTLGTSNGSACTFNKISGTYDDTGSKKNFIQIKWIAVNEAWYSISQIAS